jgi:hypothetical protein
MHHLWLFMFVTVILGCNTVDPDSCYPNPAGGTGGADSLAVGAGVGATTSGDYATEPPKGPLERSGCRMRTAQETSQEARWWVG